MTVLHSSNRILRVAAVLHVGLALAAAAHAGFGNDEFEDNTPIAHDELEWPEVEFPSAEQRGRGFRPGERIVYRAQWGIFKKAGSMEIATALDPASEEPKIWVYTESASAGFIRKIYPMKLKAKSVIDATAWRMESSEIDGKARSEVNKSLTRLDYERGLMKYEDEEEPDRSKIVPIPYDVPLDYASTFLQLRGFDLEVGRHFPVLVCTKGKFYYIDMSVEEIETIDTELGDKECYRLEPLSSFPQSKLFREGGKMSIWITKDAERIPVRFDVRTSVGTASMRIETYESGSEADTGVAAAR